MYRLSIVSAIATIALASAVHAGQRPIRVRPIHAKYAESVPNREAVESVQTVSQAHRVSVRHIPAQPARDMALVCSSVGLVGVPGGPPRPEYGSVQRCEWVRP